MDSRFSETNFLLLYLVYAQDYLIYALKKLLFFRYIGIIFTKKKYINLPYFRLRAGGQIARRNGCRQSRERP